MENLKARNAKHLNNSKDIIDFIEHWMLFGNSKEWCCRWLQIDGVQFDQMYAQGKIENILTDCAYTSEPWHIPKKGVVPTDKSRRAEFISYHMRVNEKTRAWCAEQLRLDVSNVNRLIRKLDLKVDFCTGCGKYFRSTRSTEKWCSTRCRFWSNVDVKTRTGCWPWIGNFKTDKGYGRFPLTSRKSTTAPRFAYQDQVGPIPEGHEIRHKCGNPTCCRPSHLETGTRKDNMQDASKRGRIVSPDRTGEKRAKLTRADVARIKELYASGIGYKTIQRDHFPQVHYTTIQRHIKGKFGEPSE